jgi:putative heme transporter
MPSRDAAVVQRFGRAGIVAWSIIGVTIVAAGAIVGLAAVSEVVLPLVFAAMLGIATYPLAERLQRRGLAPALAAGLVVLLCVALAATVVVLVVRAVVREATIIAGWIDRAIAELGDGGEVLGLDEDTLQQVRDAFGSVAAVIGRGLVTVLAGGVGAIVGFVTASVLGVMILYYVLKDGPQIREWLIQQLPAGMRDDGREFLATAVQSVRGYWAGRSMLSAIVTVVIVAVSLALGLPLISTIAIVNFVGGFVPYIGSLLGGGLATLLALSDGGVTPALVMLTVALVANLGIEQVLEPRIMSGRLRVHPLVVLLAVTIGGITGGIVGLMLAVPLTMVLIDLARRVRRRLEAPATVAP